MDRAAREFEALISEFYEVWFRFHPVAALQAGVSGYEGGLPAVDDDDVGALGAWLETTIVGLEELDYTALDGDRQLDIELLFGACQDEHQMLLEQDWRHRDPLGFLPLQSIHQLVLTPKIGHKEAVESCLSGVPEFLRHARSQLSSFPKLIPRLWLDSATVQAAAGIRYLGQLRDGPLVGGCQHPEQVRTLCDQASRAVAGYLDFLQQEITPQAQGVVGCGQGRFRQRLRLRHALCGDIESMLRTARRIYERTREQLQQLCVQQSGNEDLDSWVEGLAGGQLLGSSELMDLAAAQGVEMRRFIQQKNLAGIPDEAELNLRGSPGCFRPDLCQATYLAPVVGDPAPTGFLFLDLDDCGADARLAEGVIGQCIRQGWPGRHLQAVYGAISPRAGSLVRRLNPSSTMARGWPLYAEQLMFEQGYATNAEQSLVRLMARLRQSLLAIMDVEIHVNGLDPSQALMRLEALPGVSSREAESDLLAVTRRPAEYLSGLLGWHLLSLLREMLEQRGTGFELKSLHECLLEQGPVAAPLLIRRLFGTATWEELEGRAGLVA